MTIASFSLAEPAVSEAAGSNRGQRPPRPRVIVVKTDEQSIPEAR